MIQLVQRLYQLAVLFSLQNQVPVRMMEYVRVVKELMEVEALAMEESL